MNTEEMMRKIAKELWKTGYVGHRLYIDLGTPGFYLTCDSNHENLFAFVAYAKAELAKRDWYFVPKYMDLVITFPETDRMFCIWPSMIVDGVYVAGGPAYDADPTDPNSVSEAELRAICEVLSCSESDDNRT